MTDRTPTTAAHVWRAQSVKGRRLPDYCERCGRDRTPAAEATACRPTVL